MASCFTIGTFAKIFWTVVTFAKQKEIMFSARCNHLPRYTWGPHNCTACCSVYLVLNVVWLCLPVYDSKNNHTCRESHIMMPFSIYTCHIMKHDIVRPSYTSTFSSTAFSLYFISVLLAHTLAASEPTSYLVAIFAVTWQGYHEKLHRLANVTQCLHAVFHSSSTVW